jgi:hypothetical protein
MLFTIQFPLADSRLFLDYETYKLDRPSWLPPIPDEHFVRSFGIVTRRPRGGLTGWVGESIICEADNAMRFPDFRDFSYNGNTIMLRLVFRRYFFDGLAVGKYEIGIATSDDWLINSQEFDKRAAQKLLFHILNLQVEIRHPGGDPIKCKLWNCGKYLAQLYALSTTRVSALSKEIPAWWVRHRCPIILIVHRDRENTFKYKIPFKEKAAVMENDIGLHLSHHYIPVKDKKIPAWIILSDSWLDDEARRLRLYLLRLHAEKECLKGILDNISAGKINPSTNNEKISDLLQHYLNETTKRISKLELKSKAVSNFDLSTLISDAEDLVEPGWRDSLINAMERTRLSIKRKIENFITNNISIGEYYMGDNYKVGQAGAVGPNSKAENVQLNQVLNQYSAGINLEKLLPELEILRQALKEAAKTAEDDTAIGEVAQAEVAAKKGEGSTVIEHLKKAGKWALGIAEKIGTTIAAEAIKHALGMK